MTTQNLALFEGLGAKMAYLNKRQRVISQNIANANTPGYRARDLKEVNFDDVLKTIVRKNENSVTLRSASTNSAHINSSKGRDLGREQRDSYEVTPIGNSVIIEEQLIKSQETVMDYNLMTRLYHKNVGLLQTAIGR